MKLQTPYIYISIYLTKNPWNISKELIHSLSSETPQAQTIYTQHLS